MSKRQSLMPAAPPTPVHLVTDRTTGSGGGPVTMADGVALAGTFPVTISGDTIVHPKCRIDARGGPANIGRRCIVEERAVLGGSSATGSAAGSSSATGTGLGPAEGSVTLGDYVSVETGAVVEAGAVIGKGSVVGPWAVVGAGAVVGRFCTIAPRTRIAPGDRVPDFTVVHGPQRRRDGRAGAEETRKRVQMRKIEVLRVLVASVSEKYLGAAKAVT